MSRYLKENYQKIAAYVPGEQPRDQVYIKLNTNESPYPPAPGVVAALEKTDVENLRLYADPTCRVLKEKLAQLYGLEPENFFVSNGSDDILNFAFMAFPGKKGAVFADITYGFYKVFAQLHGMPYRQIPLKDDLSLWWQDYLDADALTVIANPNAPTGRSISLEQIEKILQSNADNVVVIDEAYVDFGGESCYPLLRTYDNLLVVRTYSKSRCLAGGRLGYAMGSPALIEDLEKIKFSTNPYSVNALTLKLGIATVAEEAYYRDTSDAIIRTRTWVTEQLREKGFTVDDSLGNFVFAKAPGICGEKIYRGLRERGILVRHFDTERIRDYNRITIGTQEQMARFMEAITDIMGGTQ